MTPADDRMERVTVFLTPATSAALTRATEATGDNRTDTINRAIQSYSLLAGEVRDGNRVVVQAHRTAVKPRFTDARGAEWVLCSHSQCRNAERYEKATERGWTADGQDDAWLCSQHAPGGGQ